MNKTLSPIGEIIHRYGLKPRKALSQNFIHNLNLTKRIVSKAGVLTDTNVIEIGPGPGGLTRALLDSHAKNVYCIECDTRFKNALAEIQSFHPNRLHLITGNALLLDLSKVCPPPRKIISNLPFNIATKLLVSWLKSSDDFLGLTLMFQKEVAERLVAAPGSKSYGRLSVITQLLYDVKLEFRIKKESFYPPPKVASAVVSLTRKEKPIQPINLPSLEIVTKAAFGQRRKMLRSSLKPIGLKTERYNILSTKRAEDLSIEEFHKLAIAFKRQNE